MRSLVRLCPLPFLGAALASSGCVDESQPVEAAGATGSAELGLVLGPGLSINTLDYALTGPSSFSRMGTFDVANSSTFTATLGGLPAVAGYGITVTGTASDGQTSCGGTATFNITAGMTTPVTLHLLCREPTRAGSVKITGGFNVCPVVDGLSANPAEVAVGSSLALTATAHDTDSGPGPVAYQWSATGGTITGTGASVSFNCTAPGAVTVTVTATDTDCTDTAMIGVMCTGLAPDAGAPDSSPDVAPALPNIKINEVESNGGTPGDWVELFNAGSTPADISGWVFKDNDDTHIYAIPAGTVVAPGAYYLLEEAAFGFGLGAGDSARIYTPLAATLVDSYTWTAHAPITYGRCPNGSGPFVPTASTKGAANDCGAADAGAPDTMLPPDASAPSDTAVPADASLATLEPWPGQNAVVTGDNLNQFGDNLSGLIYEPASAGNPAVLWAALNGPGTVYRLILSGGIWAFDTSNGWGAGKALHYPNGTGNPDSESVTRGDFSTPFVYVSTERNNDANTISRLSVLRFDSSTPGTMLTATHEWNLTADLPAVGANLGLEGITWVPDSYLVSHGFLDESKGAAYNPALYGEHASGVFVVAVEATGILYGYVLDHTTGAFQKVATIPSGLPGVMGLEFDRDSGALWAACDNTCMGTHNVLGIVGGKFTVRRSFARPSTLPDSNNEGIAVAPDSECSGGFKQFFWSDDSHFGGHAIRIDSIPCGPLF
jgi:hypothetical protein